MRNTVAATESVTKLKSELENAFKSATSVAKKLEIFENMASGSLFKENKLAVYIWSITRTLMECQPSHNPEQVFSFGKMALRILATANDHNIACFSSLHSEIKIDNTRSHGSSLFIACVWYLLGSCCYDLKRYGESLRYLDWADRNLSQLEEDDKNCCLGNCVRHVLSSTQLLLSRVKVAMGKNGEAVVNARKVLKFMELMIDGNRIELGNGYIDAYKAYVQAKDAKGALPLCLKALEIYSKYPSKKSLEIAILRVDLAVLYYVVGEHKKADEQAQLWKSVLRNTEGRDNLFKAETDSATMLINLGRSDKAIEDLKLKVSRNDTDENGQAIIYVIMARASCILENFTDAKEYMREAERLLEENDTYPLFVGVEFMDMSELYEKMNDLATAISLLKRVLKRLEPHQKILEESLKNPEHDPYTHAKIIGKLVDLKIFLAKCSRRLFSLISLAGGKKEEILCMFDVVEKLEKSFGLKYIEVGYGCATLGAALMNAGQGDLAIQMIEKAKDIMNVSLGPHHMDSLRTNHTLSETYEKLGRYDKAIEIQVKVVNCLGGLGPSEQQFRDKALELLNKMKEKVSESPTRASS